MVYKYIIYALTDPIKEEIRYIGKSCTGLERIKQHTESCRLRGSTKKINWIKSLLKKGIKPEYVILESAIGPENLSESERRWIYYLKNRGIRLTNMTEGGDGGYTGGEGTGKKPVYALEKTTGIKKYFESVQSTKHAGFRPTKVSAVCRGRRLSHKGHVFWYAEEAKPEQRKYKTKVPVKLVLNDTKEILYFESVKEAATYLHIEANYLSRVLAGKAKLKAGKVYKIGH